MKITFSHDEILAILTERAREISIVTAGNMEFLEPVVCVKFPDVLTLLQVEDLRSGKVEISITV